MTFDEAFALEVGAVVRVTNGRAEPPPTSPRHAYWRAANFTGAILEKIETPQRALRINDANVAAPVKARAYIIAEGGEHSFELME